MSNILGVKCQRLVLVARSLDDRAAVGKHRELITLDIELQQKSVVTDRAAQHLQMPGQFLKVQRRRHAMRHLHSVAATETCRLRTEFAVEPFKTAALTTRTIDLAQ